MRIHFHVIAFEQTQVGFCFLLPDRLHGRTGRRYAQKILQVLLVFEPEIKLTAQRRELMRMHGTHQPRMPRHPDLALRVKTAGQGFVFREVLQGRPQQGFGFVEYGVMPNGGQQRVIGDQVHVHRMQAVMKNIEHRAKPAFDFSLQQWRAIGFDAFELGKPLPGQGMVSTALSHGGVKRLDNVSRGIDQPLGQMPANQLEGF